ncbi:hypothetical protein B484DRAFT_411566, partial [Ochromonadaceae sp. CCMP2298]
VSRYADLDTGLATGGVADAFLHSDLGRQILSSPDSYQSDFDPLNTLHTLDPHHPNPRDSLDAASTQRAAAAMLGLPSQPAHREWAGADWGYVPSAAQSGEQYRASLREQLRREGESGTRTREVGRESGREGMGMPPQPPQHPHPMQTSRQQAQRSQSGVGRGVGMGVGMQGAGVQEGGEGGDGGEGMSEEHYSLSRYATGAQQRTSYSAPLPTTSIPPPYTSPSTYTAPPAPLGMGYRPEGQKRAERVSEQDARRVYASPGWKSSQGGWVADFGPPHTHTLYTGPEVQGASLNEKPWQQRQRVERRLGEDEEVRRVQAGQAQELAELKAQMRAQ